MAGALAVAALAVFYLATRDRADQPPPAPPPVPAAKPAPDPEDPRKQEARRWFVESFFDEMRRDRELPGKRIDEIFEEGRKRGYDKIRGFDWEAERKRIYEMLLRREPDHPEAHRAFGRAPLVDYPDFHDVFKKLTDARALPDDLKAFRNEYEDRVRFVPRRTAPAVEPAEFKRVAALLDRFKELDERYRNDPTYKAIAEALARVRIDPILGAYDFVHVEVRPFVLFYGSRDLKAGKPGVGERLRERLESFRRLVDDLVGFHRETWMKPLDLPEFQPGEVFLVWVFGDKESWEDYGRQADCVTPPGTRGYFSRRDHWAFVYDDAKERELVESSLAHELTHLLHWHFSKDPGSEFRNHFDRIEAVWFTEGWADYVGWTRRKGDGFVFAQNSPHRMEGFHICRKRGLPLYPLQELVKRESYLDWMREVFVAWLGKKVRLPEEPDQLTAIGELYFAMLYSQSWLFVKFLYEGEDGKYKAKMLEFTKASLKGYIGYRGERGYARAYEVFGQIFGLKTRADWDRLQAEFDRYLEAKLYEIPPLR